ncbi:hypothetical protein EW146_g2579 [Bondarzewia mesenterica]|uniref:Uncharacterized protein n=1 Tax=Bondarzewia mesenterica TaxID=1095465 RepID=A0A4S4M090_9AGAM|nr:hypothetical protein EW146_g2579 [Bondarzewia mesenterica]
MPPALSFQHDGASHSPTTPTASSFQHDGASHSPTTPTPTAPSFQHDGASHSPSTPGLIVRTSMCNGLNTLLRAHCLTRLSTAPRRFHLAESLSHVALAQHVPDSSIWHDGTSLTPNLAFSANDVGWDPAEVMSATHGKQPMDQMTPHRLPPAPRRFPSAVRHLPFA